MSEAIDKRGRLPTLTKPLPKILLKTFEAYLPDVLGLNDPRYVPLVQQAAARLDAYIQSTPPHEKVREQIVPLLGWTLVHGFFVGGFRPPWKQSARQRQRFIGRLFRSDVTFADWTFDAVRPLLPDIKPSIRDIAKSVRELMGLAFYSNPQSDWITGYERLWARSKHFPESGRTDVDVAKLARLKQPAVFDPAKVAAVHHQGHPYDASRLFANNGRPRVAVIGSGAGGAVVAAKLAATGRYDIAIFEAGPKLSPSEYPLDTLVGMTQLFEKGLMTLTRDLDIHLLRGRVVGGGTVMTSGLSVMLRQETMSRWCSKSGELALGITHEDFRRAFDEIEARQRMEWIRPSLYTDPSSLLRQGAQALGSTEAKWSFERDRHRNNVMMRAGQHGGPVPDRHGDYCLGCGLCNYGCHFGHKLSMDLTYLRDAERDGARIHQNLPIERLVGSRNEQGEFRVTAVELGRGLKTLVEVDHIVLCAGAVGSPALLLQSAHVDPGWNSLPAFRDNWVGTHFGFNYGSGAIAVWPGEFAKPGHLGFQIRYIATKSSDGADFALQLPEDYKDRFVLENAFVPPGLMSNLATGVGTHHRRWMEQYRASAMCATTLGSPMHGTITRQRAVRYRITDEELALNRYALASIARLYFAAGASEVGLAGIREHPSDRISPLGEGLRLTAGKFGEKSENEIERALADVITKAEHIMLSSAHPQGGLRMAAATERGAVDSDFSLRGCANLSVADASLFPSTIVVNPQWTVAALAAVAADRIGARLASQESS